MAAEPGFEPGLKDPKSSVLPLHNSAIQTIFFFAKCRRSDSNRHGGRPPTVFETAASACSATSARYSRDDPSLYAFLFYAKDHYDARSIEIIAF